MCYYNGEDFGDIMDIIYDKMSNGLDDICKYLNIENKKAIFLHSMANNDSSVDRKQINKGRMIYAEILSFAGYSDSKFVSCYYNEKLLDYMDKYKLINKDSLIMVGMDKKTDYPYNSVSLSLEKRLLIDDKLSRELNGYTVVPSFLSDDDIESVKIIHGKTLMDKDLQVLFNSKYYMRELSLKYGFSLPFGYKFNGLSKLREIMIYLKENHISRAWVKLVSQVSGTGNVYIDDIDDIDKIYENIMNIAMEIYDEDYIINKMPLIIEEDLSTREVINMGVEAVISDDKVVILGSVAQEVDGAVYRGSYISDKSIKYSSIAEDAASSLFVAYAKEGYRGFITVDVIVTDDLHGYCIDPNPRFSAGTMLLKNIHTSEYFTGRTMYGLSFNNYVYASNSEEVVDNIFKAIGNDLYKAVESGYQGIIPALCNDVNEVRENEYYLKSVVIADSYEKACRMYEDFKNRLKDLRN